MSFSTGAPGCCCCKFYYHGDSIVRQHNATSLDPIDGRHLESPTSNFTTLAWTYDHYHKRLFFMSWSWVTGTTTKIGYCDAKLPLDRSTIDITEVVDFGVSYGAERITTASVDEKVYYVVRDSPTTTTYSFRECAFDGTGDGTVFTRTMSSAVSGLLQRIEHCRYNDMLYYACRKSGDTYHKIYRCERDGTNDSLVYDPGATNPTIQFRTCFAFDNVAGKLYVCKRVTTSPFSGQVLQMDLDGTNEVEIYDTGDYVAPQSSYGVYAVRFNHKENKVYWVQGSTQIVTYDNPEDPDGGLWRADPDGSNAEKVYNRFLMLGGGSIAGISEFDIGCGFDTLGATTEA